MRRAEVSLLSLMVVIGWLGAAVPAVAAFKLCNQSYDVLNIAIGQANPAQRDSTPDQGQEAFVTRGWWRVAPNQCATLTRESLKSRYFYVFAADVFGKEALSGTVTLCLAPRRFVIDRQGDCLLRGYLEARFLEVDTQEQSDWTVFVSPRPG